MPVRRLAPSHADRPSAQASALHPYRTATSKPAQRAYLSGALVALSSVVLLFVATVSFFVFYHGYVPDAGASHVVHLQFG